MLAFTNTATITGNFTPGTCLLSLTGTDTPADYQAALRTITYGNASLNPSTAPRVVTFSASDGIATGTATRGLTVVAVNNPPSITAPASLSTNEGTPITITSISVADVDAGSGSEQVTLGVLHGTITINTTTGLTIVGNNSASVTLTGMIANLNGGLNGMTYTPAAFFNDTRGSEVLSISINDLGNTGTGGPMNASTTVPISIAPVNNPPVAIPQSYSTQANMKVVGMSSLLTGATDPDTGDGGFTDILTVGTVSATTPAGGVISNVNTSTGTFDFDPPPGVTGNVTFTYTVCDNGNPLPSMCSVPATATVSVAGPMIWFVNPAAATNGNGLLDNPFNTLAAAAAVDTSGQRIFLYTGTATTGITLNTNEWLIGQGVSGASFDAVFGITPPTGTIARPAIGGTRPTVQGNVAMATSDAVRGLNVAPASGTQGLTASGATSLTVGEVSATTSGAAAVNLTNSDGTISLTAVTATGGANGIVWNNASAATGSLSVTGNGGSCTSAGTCTGGAIQTTTAAGISLTNATSVSFNQMFIGSSAGSGVDGKGVNGFSFTNGRIVNAGTAGTSGSLQSAIAFDGSGSELGNNIAGTLTVTGNTFTSPHYAGLDVQSDNGTVTSANVSNNTITSPGFSGINFATTGNASTTFNLDAATINQNNISGSGGNGIQVSISNANASGPGATAGLNSSNRINITNNSVTSLASGGTQAITFALSGGNSSSRGEANFLIQCNGSNSGSCSAPTGSPLGSSAIGTVMLIGNNGYATMTGSIDSNTIVSTQTPNDGGGNGIAGGNGVAGAGNAWTPDLTLTVTNNSISGTDGNGILLVGRGTSGTARFKIAGNSVGASVNAGGFASEGIRVDAGNAASSNPGGDSVCLNMSANTSAGSNGASGLGIRKQGTDPAVNNFGIQGILQNPPSNTDVTTFLNSQNPSGHGTDIISGSGYTQCSSAPS